MKRCKDFFYSINLLRRLQRQHRQFFVDMFKYRNSNIETNLRNEERGWSNEHAIWCLIEKGHSEASRVAGDRRLFSYGDDLFRELSLCTNSPLLPFLAYWVA